MLGRNVKRLRETRQWSQDQLSEITELHRTYISGIERGTRNPTVKILERLAKALEVPTASLLEVK